MVADAHYRITQGSGAAEPYASGERTVVLPSELATVDSQPVTHVLLSPTVVLPRIDYVAQGAQRTAESNLHGKPLLVQLRSDEVTSSEDQLTEWIDRRDELQAAVDVLVLTVSSTTAVSGAVAMDGQPNSMPFETGRFVDDEFVTFLLQTNQTLFNGRTTFAPPCSVLITADGKLAAWYRGPVTVDRILDDVTKLSLDPTQLRMATLPFPGRWAAAPAFE
jgi:hypothetical protein